MRTAGNAALRLGLTRNIYFADGRAGGRAKRSQVDAGSEGLLERIWLQIRLCEADGAK
jgi:hypothetical protein